MSSAATTAAVYIRPSPPFRGYWRQPGPGVAAQPPNVSAELSLLVGGSFRLGPDRGLENGAGAPRRPGGAAAGLSVQSTFPASPRPGCSPLAAGCSGGPVPRALLLPHPSAGLQSQETTSAELEGAVEPAAPRRCQLVSRVAGRGSRRKGAPAPRARLVGGRGREHKS